ncbi:MAG: hypothetical protein ACJ8F7_20655 [Gemmataceae bacterium]
MSARFIVCAILLASAVPAYAADPAWQAMLGDLPRSEKAGFGGLCGICVDRTSGAVVINISDRGFYRSTDGAKSFRRISDAQPRGRTETPGCFLIDPTGRGSRWLTALVYGVPVSVSGDGGRTWTKMDGKSSHVDWCAIDWTDPEMKFVLALKHEAGGLLLASHDAGKSFAEVGKNFGPGWVFNATTAVVAEAKTKDRPRPNLVRTNDGGRTWSPCAVYSPVGSQSAQALPRFHDGTLYWLVEGALIASSDSGATWQKVCELRDGRFGPVFGKDGKHLFVLTAAGIVESTDGGATWATPIPPPKELKGVGGLTWVDYDPKDDALYLMKMGSDLFKLDRGGK